MSDKPNPDDFVKNERACEYTATFEVRGEVTVTIHADSEAEAKEKAEAMLDSEDFGLELDEVTQADVRRVRKSPPLYLVMKDGRPMQVSRLSPGDLPRQPDERGF